MDLLYRYKESYLRRVHQRYSLYDHSRSSLCVRDQAPLLFLRLNRSGFKPMNVGARLKKAREDAELLQKELADEVGVHPGRVSHWENGHTIPSKYVETLEDILDADLSDSVANWLKDGMEQRGIKAVDLAKSSGITQGYISNIKNGHAISPSPKTVNALAKALAISPPEAFVAERDSETDQKPVLPVGELYDLDLNDLTEVHNVAGIYVLKNKLDNPVYIGKATNIEKRIRQHQEKFWYKPPIVMRASYIECSNELLCSLLEKNLIKLFSGSFLFNKQGASTYSAET